MESVKRPIKDRSRGFNRAILAVAIVAVLSAAGAAGLPSLPALLDAKNHPNIDGWIWLARILAAVAGAAIALLNYLKSANERATKDQLAQANVDLAEELEAERIRILTVSTGALGLAARELGALGAMTLVQRRAEISGLRTSIVEKACSLVRNPAPRAAYYRVEGNPGSRIMRPVARASYNRDDEFTTIFEESSGIDSNAWSLIDAIDEQAVLEVNLDEHVPPGYLRTSAQRYKCYISAPIRAGGHAFGMLTINTKEVAGLDERDRASMQLLGRLLATAEALALSPQQWSRIRGVV